MRSGLAFTHTQQKIDSNHYEKHLMNIYLVKKKLLIGMQTNDVIPTTKFSKMFECDISTST